MFYALSTVTSESPLNTQEADGLKYAYGAPKKKYLNEEGPSK